MTRTDEAYSDVRWVPSHGHFAPLIESSPDVLQVLKGIGQLAAPGAPPVIFPDLEIKKTGGVSGVCLRVPPGSPIYPFLVPDFGCGFCVLRLPPVPKRKRSLMAETILAWAGSESAVRDRIVSRLDFSRVLLEGVSYLLDIGLAQRSDSDLIEKRGVYVDVSPDLIVNNPDFIETAKRCFGRCAGHFFTVREVVHIHDLPQATEWGLGNTGSLVLVIHSGAMALTALALRAFARLRPRFQSLSSPQSARTNNVLALSIPADSMESRMFLGAVAALQNYSFASRTLATTLLRRAFSASRIHEASDLQMLSDRSHSGVASENAPGEEGLIYRRGVQCLQEPFGLNAESKPLSLPTFIAGGKEGWCYLVVAGPRPLKEGLCPHGVSSWSPPEDGEDDWLSAHALAGHLRTSLSDTPIDLPMSRLRHVAGMRTIRALARFGLVSPVLTLAPWLNLEAQQC